MSLAWLTRKWHPRAWKLRYLAADFLEARQLRNMRIGPAAQLPRVFIATWASQLVME